MHKNPAFILLAVGVRFISVSILNMLENVAFLSRDNEIRVLLGERSTLRMGDQPVYSQDKT
jgi:hypothetical protein